MKKLIITAAPNKSSFTHKIALKLKEKYINSEIINLYDNKYKLDFLEFENKRAMPEKETIKLIQEKIKSFEEIIFVFPVWWGGMPAIMKNMFDSVFISGFAFEY
jgi:NAD(P)H dehydrogenase (quinone)